LFNQNLFLKGFALYYNIKNHNIPTLKVIYLFSKIVVDDE